MWLMLTTGALSIVARDPEHTGKGDERTLVVRARRTEWLDEFRARWCPELSETVHDEHRDYQYRAYVRPDDLALAVARVTLAIGYHNFKGATQSAAHGLPDAKLRNSLHDAYAKCWSVMLNAGDGTSAYDWKSYKPAVTGIEACYRWGHWWPQDQQTGLYAEKCKDCGAVNPAHPQGVPAGKVYPQRPAKGKAAGGISKKSRKRKAKKQVSAKGYASKTLKGSDGCEGSWQEPDADTVAFPTAYNGYQETGVCWFCGERVRLTPDGLLELHWEGVPA